MLRLNSLVQLNTKEMTDRDCFDFPAFFHDGTPIVYMGEIPNKPGCGIFLCKNHHYIGYKVSLFREITDEEADNIKE